MHFTNPKTKPIKMLGDKIEVPNDISLYNRHILEDKVNNAQVMADFHEESLYMFPMKINATINEATIFIENVRETISNIKVYRTKKLALELGKDIISSITIKQFFHLQQFGFKSLNIEKDEFVTENNIPSLIINLSSHALLTIPSSLKKELENCTIINDIGDIAYEECFQIEVIENKNPELVGMSRNLKTQIYSALRGEAINHSKLTKEDINKLSIFVSTSLKKYLRVNWTDQINSFGKIVDENHLLDLYKDIKLRFVTPIAGKVDSKHIQKREKLLDFLPQHFIDTLYIFAEEHKEETTAIKFCM